MGFTNNTRRVDGLACYPTEWAKKNSESQLCIILPLNKILRIENRTDLWTQGLKVHIQPWSWSWSPGATFGASSEVQLYPEILYVAKQPIVRKKYGK